MLNVDTGAYEVDTESVVANERLRSKYPNTNPRALFAIRIGYDAMYAIRGSIRRTAPYYDQHKETWLNDLKVETLAAQIQQKRAKTSK